jgi:FKBP-type peptidyl-prolyl cis-trans isomerase SlyD
MVQDELMVQTEWVVELEYSLKLEDGELVADSGDDGALTFIQGRGHVFPVIEGAINGMRLGEEMELLMPPDETYGDYDPEAVELLPLEAFPDDQEITVGLELELLDEDTGNEIDAIVTKVLDDEVVVDLNHPLAGETLIMWLRVVELRPATEEELAQDYILDE